MTGKVLVMTDSYLPGFAGGGPVRSVSNLITRMPETAFSVATRDRDPGDLIPFAIGRRHSSSNSTVDYLDAGRVSFVFHLARVMKRERGNVLYLNSFFSPCFTILPLLLSFVPMLRPGRVILAPRGELSAGALQFSPWKKKFYMAVFRRLLLGTVSTFQVTSREEQLYVQSLYPKTSSLLLGNVPTAYFHYARERGASGYGGPKFLYLGRVSEKKNVIEVIRAFKLLNDDRAELTIVGPAGDSSYLQRCVAEAGGVESVRFLAGVPHDEVGSMLLSASYFIHPSLDENFGHAIFEALSTGMPAVVGSAGPWARLAGGGGWVVDPRNGEQIAAVMRQAAQLSSAEYLHKSGRALDAATQYLNALRMDDYLRMFFPANNPHRDHRSCSP